MKIDKAIKELEGIGPLSATISEDESQDASRGRTLGGLKWNS